MDNEGCNDMGMKSFGQDAVSEVIPDEDTWLALEPELAVTACMCSSIFPGFPSAFHFLSQTSPLLLLPFSPLINFKDRTLLWFTPVKRKILSGGLICEAATNHISLGYQMIQRQACIEIEGYAGGHGG